MINRNFLSQEYLFKKFNVKKEDVVKFDYRGEGWIGGMTIMLKNGDKIHSPLPIYWSKMLRMYFIPLRCTLCSDQSCELADASFGDIWLPEFRDDKIGTSVIISRTEAGDKILSGMKLKKEIGLNKIERDKLVESQINPLRTKKNHLSAHFTFLKLLRKKIPIYNQKLLEPNFGAYLHTILLYLQSYLSSKRYLWWLLEPLGNLLSGLSKIKQRLMK